MKITPLTTLFALWLSCALAQSPSISGTFLQAADEPLSYANVALYSASDSSLTKVAITDEQGRFAMANVEAGSYFLQATFLGYEDHNQKVDLSDGQSLDLGVQQVRSSDVVLETATVVSTRSLVEVKPDRTIFNVEGTINSAGDNSLGLLRKAPGLVVDNNFNISILGRSNVLVYLDGKRLPLTGSGLATYLQNIAAEQIDRIEIISNPGAAYDSEGSGGIIDIILKKDKNLGANGSIATTFSQGDFARGNATVSGNYRTKKFNTFGEVSLMRGKVASDVFYRNTLNGFITEETYGYLFDKTSVNYRIGTDFHPAPNHIIGLAYNGGYNGGPYQTSYRNELATVARPETVDSILISADNYDPKRINNSFNVNYNFRQNGHSLNIDANYGSYSDEADHSQPNSYFAHDGKQLLSVNNKAYETLIDIDIYTASVDYSTRILEGDFSLGAKYSRVSTDNSFLFYDVDAERRLLNRQRSNEFFYDENVYAGYFSYARGLGEKWSMTMGLRLEQTDATGELITFDKNLSEPPVELNYLNVFPNFSLTYSLSSNHSFLLSYSRRINRPDYFVLNPFRSQTSELSFGKGNPNLQPEIGNNIELGYTLKGYLNFRLAYSRVDNQITQLIGPDDVDPRAGFISWDNLETLSLYSFSASLPFSIGKKWNSYLSLVGSYQDNQADYGGGNTIDLQAWSYNIYQQHTFDLPFGFRGEISGWYAGPGIWGGVFETDASWSLDLGLQRKFFQQLDVKLSAQDIFFQSWWSGTSDYNGLSTWANGNFDSRRVILSLGYTFGNSNVRSRNRAFGSEDELRRTGG
ncbi:MAG: outer membrane beta-barrel family protein [Bacteroidota bacterium]